MQPAHRGAELSETAHGGPGSVEVAVGSVEHLIDSRWPEKALSVSMAGPCGPVDLHTVHVPPGSSLEVEFAPPDQ